MAGAISCAPAPAASCAGTRTSASDNPPARHVRMQVPDVFNAADYFVDRHLREQRGDRVAIECGDEHVTYKELADRVARFSAALVHRFGVRREERVLLWLLDGPPFFYAFWGAIRAGAVAVPVNTMWTGKDLAYVLNDCRARVAVVSAALLP